MNAFAPPIITWRDQPGWPVARKLQFQLQNHRRFKIVGFKFSVQVIQQGELNIVYKDVKSVDKVETYEFRIISKSFWPGKLYIT